MRRFSITLAAVAAVMSPIGAGAASFDCAKAGTPLERAICASPELGAADEDMAAAFSAARKRLSPDGAAVVLENQRTWLGFAERACTENAEPLTSGRYDSDGMACLATVFRNRADALARIGPVGGLLFYPVDVFNVVPDTDPDTWSKVATTEISFAQMDGSGEEADAFNAHVFSLIEPVLSAPPDPEMDSSSDIATEIAVTEVTPKLIVLAINEYFYGHGAAHGNYAVTYSNFLRDERRPVAAGDVFRGDDWALSVKPLVIDRLNEVAEAEMGEPDMLWEDLTGLEDAIADPSRWEIRPDGIGFQFQPYEVAAYAYGAPMAVLSWDELHPWLAPGARTRLAGD